MTTDDDATAEFRVNFFKWRDTYGLLSSYVTELRELIVKASRHDWLTDEQRDELLALVQQIDAERGAIVGDALTDTKAGV